MPHADAVVSIQGVHCPRIIYGTAWKKSRTPELVKAAIDAGFRGIDTACQPKHYNEAGVGAGIAAAASGQLHRSQLYLQTKFTPPDGQDPQQIPYDATAPLAEQVAQSFAASLQNLQTQYLDCLLLHSPLGDMGQTIQAWRAMEAIVDAGGALQLGISNCYDLKFFTSLYHAARIKPAVIQNRFHARSDYDRGIRQFCRQEGIIYQSFWTLTANPHVLTHEEMIKLAAKYGRTAAQVFFRYLTQEHIVPLTGTKSLEHMQQDLAIFEFELPASECALVASML